MKANLLRILLFGGVTAASLVLYQNFSNAFVAVFTPAQFYHQTGFADQGGWATNVNSTPGAMIYGPYVTNLPAQKLVVSFVLGVDNNTADNAVVATLDVYDSDANQILAQKSLRRGEMAPPGSDGNHTLSFNWSGRAGHRAEFRIWPSGTTYLRVDGVAVQADVSTPALSIAPNVYNIAAAWSSETAAGSTTNYVFDASTTSSYSSNGFATPANTRGIQLAAWTATQNMVSRIHLTPKKINNVKQGFPVTTHVFVANVAGNNWQYVGLLTPQFDSAGNATIELGGYYKTNGVLLQPDVLGSDSTLGYSFQIADLKLSNDPSTGTLGPFQLAQSQFFHFDRYVFAYLTNGNLVIYNNHGLPNQFIVWTANVFADCAGTANKCLAIFQTDGNLVLYRNNVPYWASGTYGLTNAHLQLGRRFPFVTILNSAGSSVWPFLNPGTYLNISPAQRLIYQPDGNLVNYALQHPTTFHVLSATRTYGRSCSSGCKATMNPDGSVSLTQNGTAYYNGLRP